MDILGGVPTQEYSDIPEAEDLLGGSDPGRLFRRKKTILDTAKEAIDPRNIIGAGEALLSIGSATALAPASMLYALRPGQKTQGSPLEFATRNMYLPRTESGIRHLEGLGEVLEQLPQTGPLPELQAFTGMTRGMGAQAAQKAREARSAIAPAVAQGAENLLESQGLLMRAAPSSPKMQAPASDLGFYDPVYQTALNIQRKEGPGQAFLNELQRGENVNKEFLEQSGIAEKLRTTPKISREEVQELAKGAVPEIQEIVKGENLPDPPNWNRPDLVLPQGKNYREVLLTMPDTRQVPSFEEWYAKTHVGSLESVKDNPRTMQLLQQRYEREKENMPKVGGFRSSHWKEPNVVAHIRMNDRTDADGKKVLFVEELQSDWAQEGRKKGFAPKDIDAQLKAGEARMAERGQQIRQLSNRMAALDDTQLDEFNRLATERQRLQDLQTEETDWGNRLYDARREGVASAPFVTKTNEWVDLALKNIIKRAVDEGYDRVAFINGKQAADRSNLTNYINSVRVDRDFVWEKYEDYKVPRYDVTFTDKQGKKLDLELRNIDDLDWLDEYVGRDVAKKIKEQFEDRYNENNIVELSGLDLAVGGEGMKSFYNKIVPKQVEALLKKYGGGKLGEVKIDFGGKGPSRYPNYETYVEAQRGPASQPGFDITPEMRERFQKPIPYKEGGLVTLMKEGGDVMKMANKAIRQSLKPIELPELKMIDAPAEDVDALRRSVMELIGMQPQEVQMAGGGDPRVKLSAEAAKAARKSVAERVGKTLTKVADKSVATQSEIEKEVERSAKRIAKENPKLTYEEAYQKAERDVTAKLRWERIDQPGAVKEFGELEPAPYTASVSQRYRNVPEQVEARAARAEAFLNQPTEPWQPPKPELQAFDRSLIRDALEGFPGVEQTRFPRYQPARANIGYVNEMYDDPRNRELIKKQIKRGLPLGGETFYASLYPLKVAALERGIPAEKFDQFIYEIAPASARNSIMNEMAVGQFLRDMAARGLPLDEQTVTREMANFKSKYGVGLPLMPVHREGVRQVIEGGLNLRDQLKADIPTNYKIPTYGTQKAGDFGKSVVLDVHEAKGETQASPYHPYFSRQGGFGPTEYGTAEGKMLDIAQELGIPGGMAQAGRWFGGGELTGLKSPRGDALDLLEKQQAYTLAGQGIKPTPKNIRKSILDMIETGRGTLMPYFKDEGMPDVRTTKKKGGAVRKSGLSAQTRK